MLARVKQYLPDISNFWEMYLKRYNNAMPRIGKNPIKKSRFLLQPKIKQSQNRACQARGVTQNASSIVARHVEMSASRTAHNATLPFLLRLSLNFTSSYFPQIRSISLQIISPPHRKLNLFSTSVSIYTHDIFTGLNLPAGPTLKNDIMLSLARLDHWISTVIQNLTIKNACRGTRKDQFGEFFSKFSNYSQTR